MNLDPTPSPSPTSGRRENQRRLTRLDRAVMVISTLILALIAVTLLLGDHVGVEVVQGAPVSKAHSTSPITLHFKEPMDASSVAAHFQTRPDLKGSFSWNGSTMIFRASEAMTPGSEYTVSLEPGALSQDGRAVLSEYQYSFTVMPPRVAYLAPADGAAQNLWLVDPAAADDAQQITHSADGIYDYAVSPDGTQIAYAEKNNGTGTADLMLLDLASGAVSSLTHCQTAMCTTPVWRPDGQMIAYERAENDPQFGSSPARIWLLDLSVTPLATRPLFSDGQTLGYGAQWSADGSRISLLDSGSSSLKVYDFNTQKTVSIPTQNGSPGLLSPDGTRLLYPDMTFDASGGARTTLKSALVDTGEVSLISEAEGDTNDQVGEWSPDGTQIAIGRQQNTAANGLQIDLLDLRSEQTTPLTSDPRYSNTSFSWDPTGKQLVIYRFPLLGEDMKPDPMARPQIWTLDVASGALAKLADNAFMPNWVP
ncbi:MAG: hypothetical protein GC204_08650 [Chloroflexi bacterium]|nr:hypothetical protein [Chloroflexota bacterium]